MKTRSQSAPKPLRTVALAPKPLKTVALAPKPLRTVALAPKPLRTVAVAPAPKRSSPKRRPRPKPARNVDPRAPKKPPTAFFYFMEDFRKIYQEENPSVKSMQEIGKVCGEKWNTMAFEEKVKYYDIATEKRAEFQKALAEYNKKKASGEMSDESDSD